MRAHVDSHQYLALTESWELTETAPGKATNPSALEGAMWRPAQVPGTVESAVPEIQRLGRGDVDASEWWYRCHFDLPTPSKHPLALDFEGLATQAEIWLNGQRLFSSDNMFQSHRVEVAELLHGQNWLYLRFGSLADALAVRRARPRWRTRLVEHQQLRWHRTTLLGRMPAWSPPIKPVGPWKPVTLEEERGLQVVRASLRSSLDGDDGRVGVDLRLHVEDGRRLEAPRLCVGTRQAPLSCEAEGPDLHLRGELRLPKVARWWPHTHGSQPLHDVRVEVTLDGLPVSISLGRTGFRTLTVDSAGRFALAVNETEVFCRGVCWTPLDMATLLVSPVRYRVALEELRAAGMNMIRVGGTMVYEADAFYDLCDELGILVWQDFMFANMDYPIDDPGFAASVETEARQLLSRFEGRPCIAMLCGSSEGEQQAAMVGQLEPAWSNAFFRERLPAVCKSQLPDVPYCTSSPSGPGDSLPFRVKNGPAHYYGVGAYLRPLEDARRADVGFASECLAFSNVPEEPTVALLLDEGAGVHQSLLWKSRVPRDGGSSWDFEDVRDHYLELLFRLDSRELRARDPDRYLALGRVTTGEVMANVLSEWRRQESRCAGALIWFYRDLWPGAGWGLIDSTGLPKAAYYYVKRVLQPLSLLISDEGLDGLHLHAINETEATRETRLSVTLYRGEVVVAQATRPLPLSPRSTIELDAEGLLGRFVDIGYAYRFGPPAHDLVVASLHDASSEDLLAEAFHFPHGLPSSQAEDPGLSATLTAAADGSLIATLRTERLAQAVAFGGDVRAEDSYFHLAPGATRAVRLRLTGAARPRASLRALNCRSSLRLELPVPNEAPP
jgi:beta-mannosidase